MGTFQDAGGRGKRKDDTKGKMPAKHYGGERMTCGNPTVKVGDVFVSCWGYDQTNREFIKVMEISSSGKTALCRRVRPSEAENYQKTYHSLYANANSEEFGDKFRMRIERYGSNIALRGSYPFCCDGSMEHTRLGTLSRVDEGRAYDETDSMYGH